MPVKFEKPIGGKPASRDVNGRLLSFSTRNPVNPRSSRLKLVLLRGFSVLSTERMYPKRNSLMSDRLKM